MRWILPKPLPLRFIHGDQSMHLPHMLACLCQPSCEAQKREHSAGLWVSDTITVENRLSARNPGFLSRTPQGLPLLPAAHWTSCSKADPKRSGRHGFCCVLSPSVILLWTRTGASWYRPRLSCEPPLSLPDTGVLRLPYYFLTGSGSVKILLCVSPCISEIASAL